MIDTQISSIVISKSDYSRISELLMKLNQINSSLAEEIERAQVVGDEELPADVVRVGSIVRFKDVETQQISTLTLVYPEESSSQENRVSILAPVGSALIGLRPGQVIEWPIPRGVKRIQVLAVEAPQ